MNWGQFTLTTKFVRQLQGSHGVAISVTCSAEATRVASLSQVQEA